MEETSTLKRVGHLWVVTANAACLADDALKERLKGLCQGLRRVAGDAVGAAGIHDREVALLVCRTQVHEQVERCVDDEIWPAASIIKAVRLYSTLGGNQRTVQRLQRNACG